MTEGKKYGSLPQTELKHAPQTTLMFMAPVPAVKPIFDLSAENSREPVDYELTGEKWQGTKITLNGNGIATNVDRFHQDDAESLRHSRTGRRADYIISAPTKETRIAAMRDAFAQAPPTAISIPGDAEAKLLLMAPVKALSAVFGVVGDKVQPVQFEERARMSWVVMLVHTKAGKAHIDYVSDSDQPNTLAQKCATEYGIPESNIIRAAPVEQGCVIKGSVKSNPERMATGTLSRHTL